MSQRRTENIQTANSQSDLKREYKDDFRDGSRLEAISAIEKTFSPSKEPSTEDQLKAYRLACFIFEVRTFCFWNPLFVYANQLFLAKFFPPSSSFLKPPNNRYDENFDKHIAVKLGCHGDVNVDLHITTTS